MSGSTPTPSRLYIHDDLTEPARATGLPPVVALADTLLAAVRREPHVTVLTETEQVAGVLAAGARDPFATAIGIGRAGERVAGVLHARTGWFPSIVRVNVAREEDGRGMYVLAGPRPLAQQVAALSLGRPLAVVDDTIFSGFTMRAVLDALPRTVRDGLHVFCLRAVAESLRQFASVGTVVAGFAAPGRMPDEVSFINASGLVRRGAIRRVGAPPLAFFEREEWMHAWFPRHAAEITALCARLTALLENAAMPSVARAPAV